MSKPTATDPTFTAAQIDVARSVIADAPAYRSDRRALLRKRLAAGKCQVPAADYDALLELGRQVRGLRAG